MRYYAYIGNPDFGIKGLRVLNSRGLLTFLIYFIFSAILYSVACDLDFIQRAIFVILITFSLAFIDATVDYVIGFHFSFSNLFVNTSSAVLSFTLIVLCSTYRQHVKNKTI